MHKLIEKLHEMESVIEKEFNAIIEQGCVKPDQWENLGEAVDIVKDIVTVDAMQSNGETVSNEYSRDSMPYVHMPMYPYSRDGESNGNSYNNDQMDSRGSRDGYHYPTYSRSGDNQSAIMVLERKLDMTRDPKARESMIETINFLRKEG